MLGKIIKHELKSTARIYLPLYSAFIIVTLINAFVVPYGGSALAVSLNPLFALFAFVVAMLYVLMAWSIMLGSMIVTAVRFYRMLGDEGHLWFTLPVTMNTHILGKLLPAFLWTFCSAALTALSLLLMVMGNGYPDALSRIANLWTKALTAGLHPGLWLICIVIIVLTAWLSSTLFLYTAMSIGSNLTRSRLGGSALAFIGLSVVNQVLHHPVALLTSTPLQQATEAIATAYRYLDIAMLGNALDQASITLATFNGLYAVALSAACYLTIYLLLENKLNLV